VWAEFRGQNRPKTARKELDDEANAAAEIPEVFSRMPAELLERYAQHGVVGAKRELGRRRQKPSGS